MSACVLLGLGAEYAAVKGAEYTRILFSLSKAMVFMICHVWLLQSYPVVIFLLFIGIELTVLSVFAINRGCYIL